MIPKKLLQGRYERIAIEIIGQIGIDINLSVMFSHKSSLMQFVAGLGRTKADYIIRRIQNRSEVILDRIELFSQKYVGKIVYINCAGFLRISSGVEQIRELLDQTRIHPDSYNLTYKICRDSCDDINLKTQVLSKEL